MQVLKVGRGLDKWRKLARKSQQRYLILKEWAETEQTYISDLRIMRDKIQAPLLSRGVIDEQEEGQLFPNLQSILRLSEQLLQTVLGLINGWDPVRTVVGEPIAHFHKFFMIYRDYCNNFLRGQALLQKIRAHSESAAVEATLKMDFESYAIKPVQRPPKYQLLLREYQKALPVEHPDQSALADAIRRYKEVNEANNQSMDRQIRDGRMIELDHKYGGIISSRLGRIYLKECEASFQGIRTRVYIFNDLVLLVGHEDKQKVLARIMLDGSSFVVQPMDGKYFPNRVFVCGAQVCAHLAFGNQVDQQNFFLDMSELIQDIYGKEEERYLQFLEMETKRRNLAHLRVYHNQQWETANVICRPGARIIVDGLLRTASGQDFYVVQFHVGWPYSQVQLVHLQLKDFVDVQQQLQSKYRNLSMPLVDSAPDGMSYYDVIKNGSQILERRATLIESLVNTLLRNDDLSSDWAFIVTRLGVCAQLWTLASHKNYQCNCRHCIELKDEQELPYYVQLLHRLKPSQHPGNNAVCLESTLCPWLFFSVQKAICKMNKSSASTLEDAHLLLSAKLGQLDYALIDPARNWQGECLIRVHVGGVDDNTVELKAKRDIRGREVVEEISARYDLPSLRDYSLYLMDREGGLVMVSGDQLIFEAASHAGVDLDGNSLGNSGFLAREYKKWKMESESCGKLYLQKVYYLQTSLQQQAWGQYQKRSGLLLGEMFSKAQSGKLILSDAMMRTLCALYYCLNEHEKLPQLNQTNFQPLKLKALLPQAQWSSLLTPQNQQIILEEILWHYNDIKQRHQRQISEETLLHQYRKKALKVLSKEDEWRTTYFQVQNHEPNSLPGADKSVRIGINYNCLVVVPCGSTQRLLQLPLETLHCRITIFSIFLDTPDCIYRFNGKGLYQLKKLVQVYRCYQGIEPCRISHKV